MLGAPGLNLVLGSLLFSVHTHSLGDSIQVHSFKCHLCTDNSQMYVSTARTTAATTTFIQATDISLLNYSSELLTCLFQTIFNVAGRTEQS